MLLSPSLCSQRNIHWLKKPAQKLPPFRYLTSYISIVYSHNVHHIYVIALVPCYHLLVESCDLIKNWWNDETYTLLLFWAGFLTFVNFHVFWTYLVQFKLKSLKISDKVSQHIAQLKDVMWQLYSHCLVSIEFSILSNWQYLEASMLYSGQKYSFQWRC